MTNAGTERNPIEILAEEFAARLRKGERPALTEYVERHPELADEIRELFPALVMMEQLKPAEDGSAPAIPATDVRPLEQIGDYRILRKIGQGGMGVVYEAEQISLGRHVALKVLLSGGLATRTYLERFRREAKAAARLHHSNIVPVYGVGEENGVHYYAMQFIHGEGLDRVLEDVRRMRANKNGSRVGPPPSPTRGGGKNQLAPPPERGEDTYLPPPAEVGEENLFSSPLDGRGKEGSSCETLARSLVMGQFEQVQAAEDPSFVLDGSSDSGPRTARFELPAEMPSVTLSGKRSEWEYCRTVARIALQVAEALAYAHRQGILHRDIKPSNLLLDLQGTVWVTDFGLAKAEGTNELTDTGDIVGTLRYMAPERFEGASLPQSDIFSLGMTLYEMLTLRPAYDEAHRARLMQRILHEDATRPRKLEPRIPRDLEIIVLKAIAREPRYRYARAEDLAEDLRRFLSDRPILARRTPWREHAWRWVRRNPGWAATLGAALSLLVVMAVGGVFVNLHLRYLNLNLADAVTSAKDAELDKTEKLWQALLERARAARSSGRLGQRFEALEAIRAASEIRVTPELRDEAVAALALPDLVVAREWEGYPEGTIDLAFDRAFERYARINREGEITVCRLSREGEQVEARLPAHGEPPYHLIKMSSDGRFLVYGHSCIGESSARGARVWKLTGPTPAVLLDEPAGKSGWAVAFHPRRPWLALGHGDGTVSIFDLETGQRLRRVKLGYPPLNLAFHPTSGLLAAACGNEVRILDTENGRELSALKHPEGVGETLGLAWHPGGRVLASGANDCRIRFWDTQTGSMMMATPEGQFAAYVYLAYNHQGDQLVSAGWGGQNQIWSTNDARRILALGSSSNPLEFSQNDSLLGYQRSGSTIRLWSVANGHELRVLGRRNSEPGERFQCVVFHADGRTLMASSPKRLSIYDLHSNADLASVPLAGYYPAFAQSFDQRGGWLTSGGAGLLFWPAKSDLARPELLHVGPPHGLSTRRSLAASFSLDHRIMAVPQGGFAVVLDRDRPGWHVDLGPLYDVRNCAVSPDGRWVVTCSWWWDGRSPGTRLWDVETGRQVREFPSEGAATAAFGPDGRWLATTDPNRGCQLWEVGSWRAACRFKENGCVFSPDGKFLALSDVNRAVKVVEAASGREIFRVTGLEPVRYEPACFSPDGSQLVATCLADNGIYVWDLRLIRSELRELGLDWDWPEFPPAPAHDGATEPRVVEVDPGFLRAPSIKDEHQAIAIYGLCLALQAFNPEAHLQRGLAHERLGNWRSVIADYDSFLALVPPSHPRYVEVLCRHAIDCWSLRDLAATARALQEVTAVEPDLLPWPDQIGGLCNSVVWQYVRAPRPQSLPGNLLALIKKALQIEPFSPLYQNTLGVTYYRLGQCQDSIDCLEQKLKGSRDLAAWDLYFLAMSYHRLGQADRARQYFEQADVWLQEHPNLVTAATQEIARIRSEAATLLGVEARRSKLSSK